MKVVVDTNIFISALMNSGGAPRHVIRQCLTGAIQPLMGNALYSEYEAVCGRRELFRASLASESDREALLNAFLSSCLWVPIYYLWRPNLSDEADNHLIELSIGGGATTLITANKKDFTRAELLFPHLKIRTAGEFLSQRVS